MSDDEYQPNWDRRKHEDLAEQLGKATVSAEETQKKFDAKNPLFKRFSYDRHYVEGANARLAGAQEKYDNQLVEAASRQDIAHEQALVFENISSSYKDTAQMLKEKFGIELPEQKMEYFIKMAHHDDLTLSNPNAGIVLALKDLFTPVQEIEHSEFSYGPTRAPRPGLGSDLNGAAQEASEKGSTTLLHLRHGAVNIDRNFYHGGYKDVYIPIDDSLKQLLTDEGIGRLGSKVNRSYDSRRSAMTGISDLMTTAELVPIENATAQIEKNNLPVSVELHYSRYSSWGSSRRENGRIADLKAETPEEMRQSILKKLIEEDVISGRVVVDGKEMKLGEFLLGPQDEHAEEEATAA